MLASDLVPAEPPDRPSGDWPNLERFQRTRQSGRLMAKVIHSLWIDDVANPLIMPGANPFDDAGGAAEMTRYLDDRWRPELRPPTPRATRRLGWFPS